MQSLPTADLAADACTVNPAVIAWTWPSGVAGVATAALPADIPLAGDPQMVVSTGSVTITDNIDGDDPNTPELEALLIVSGCHIIIDGPCVYDIEDPGTGVITPADPTSEQRCSQPDPADAVPDTKQPLAISIEKVIVVAAGGIWAADLQSVGCAYRRARVARRRQRHHRPRRSDLQTGRLRRRCLERPRETRRRVRPHQRAAYR